MAAVRGWAVAEHPDSGLAGQYLSVYPLAHGSFVCEME